MIVLPGYGERIPEQEKQAESCRVKAIRWCCFPGGCYGHNDPFVPRVIIRRSRPSVVALLSNGNHQSRLVQKRGRGQEPRREKKKPGSRICIKFQRWHRRFRGVRRRSGCVWKPRLLSPSLFTSGALIHPAASMAMYSTRSAQEKLPPRTRRLRFDSSQGADESRPAECVRDDEISGFFFFNAIYAAQV